MIAYILLWCLILRSPRDVSRCTYMSHELLTRSTHMSHELYTRSTSMKCVPIYIYESRTTYTIYIYELCHGLHIGVTNYIHTSRRIHSIAHFLSLCPISRSSRGMSQTTHVSHELHTHIMTLIHHCTLLILVPDMDVFQRCVADYACESRTTYIHHDSCTSLRTCYFGARYGGLLEENCTSRHTYMRHELRIMTHTYC